MKSLNIIILSIAAIVILFMSCSSPSEKTTHKNDGMKGTISISGAFALYPMVVKWAEEFKKEYPEVRIDISAGGAGKGMTDALSGMVDLAMVSREISQAEIDKGAWFLAVTKDAVLPTTCSKNPLLNELMQKGLTQEMFREIYLSGKAHNWEEFLGLEGQTKMNVYTRSDACGAAEMWGKFLGKNQESLLGVGVFGDPGIADAVKQDELGIGFNNVIYAFDISTRKKYDGLEVIPVDMNGNRVIDPEENFYGDLDQITAAIQDGRYPSPPARDLYLVSKGQPSNPVVIKFLSWILSDGQKYVHEGGYVALPQEKINHELQKLQ